MFEGEECLGARLHRDEGPVSELAPDCLDLRGLRGGQARELARYGSVVAYSRRVWTVGLLERALCAWAEVYAGRGDLRFVCRDDVQESPLMRLVRERLEAAE